jgi:hypothetical protein
MDALWSATVRQLGQDRRRGEYGEHEVRVKINTLAILGGSLPRGRLDAIAF